MSQSVIEMPIAIDRPVPVPPMREVFDQHAPFVWRTVRYLGVAEPDIQDVCQEVFLIVSQKLTSFEGRSSIETWIYGITVRAAANHRRKAYTRKELPTDTPPESSIEIDPSAALDDAKAKRLLVEVLAQVTGEEREVFVLFEIEGRAMTEIAALLGCPLRTAYTRLHAARDRVMHLWAGTLKGNKR